MKPKRLEIAQINITNACQCNCKHCGVSFLRQHIKETLSIQDLEYIFQDLKASGCKIVDLFGGEPTIREDIFEIVSLGKSYGFGMLIESNGYLLDREFVKKLKDSGLDRLFLSLDDYREELHDERRKRQGAYKRVLKAIEYASLEGITVHVSIVPPNKDFFTDGHMNKFMELCFNQGADKVRILFPSDVGNWSKEETNKISKKDEIEVFKCIDQKYYDRIYTEAEHNPIGDESSCSAKNFFAHIMSNGQILPCPYLPFVFGNIYNESITTIFNRIQEHPVMRQNGLYCPSRDPEFMKKYLSEINKDNPFKFINSENIIDLAGPCNNDCMGCNLKYKTKEDIITQIDNVDKDYDTLHIYGGEFFLRKDIGEILDSIPSHFKLNFYTNARLFIYPEMIAKLKKYNINSVKIPFFAENENEFEKHTKKIKSYSQTIQGIKKLVENQIPVCIYIPEKEVSDSLIERLKNLGVVSISSYQESGQDANKNLTLCFGKKIVKEKLIWIMQ